MEGKLRRALGILLSFVLVIGLTSGSVPGTILAAYASESGETIVNSEESKEAVTEGNTGASAEEVETEIVESEAVETETVESETVESETADSEEVETETVEPETVEEETEESDTEVTAEEGSTENSNSEEDEITVTESEEDTVSTEEAESSLDSDADAEEEIEDEISVEPETVSVEDSAKEAQEAVSYVYFESDEKKEGSITEYTVVDSNTTTWESEKWYVVNADTTISNLVTVSGTVNLILCDGKTLTAEKGINVANGNTLYIYAQSEGSGILSATGSDSGAGIGGGNEGTGGTIIIHGGKITAVGNNGGAGIGGGNKGAGADVTINAGTVTASGGTVVENGEANSSKFGTGIGAGYSDDTTLGKGNLVISENMLKVLGGSSANPTEVITDYSTNRPQYMIVLHAHSFTYAADGSTITATCSVEGCDLPDNKVSLTISASDSTYNGSAYTGASLESTAWAAAGLSVPTIEYEGRSETSYTKSTTAPTSAGTYTASVTVDSSTATANFTISKADPTAEAPTGLTATYGQTLANVTLTNPEGNTPGSWAWVDDTTTSVGNAGTNTFKANFTPTDTTNYNSKSNVDVNITVGKAANPASVTGTASVDQGGSSVDLSDNVTLNGVTGDVTYVISGTAKGCSLSGSILTSGDTSGSVTVYVSVAEDSNYLALASTPITVTINKVKISRTVTFKVVNGSWNSGSSATKTVTLTGYMGDTLKLSSSQIPSVGSNPDTNYKEGSWDVTPSTSTAITSNKTYTYTYEKKKKISVDVIFKVVNGSWNDKTTAKKTVTLTGYEGDTLKLDSDDIPAVGSRPNTNYKAGSWDKTPSTKTEITKDTTYTYTYAKKSSSSSSSSSKNSAKTGDNNMIWLWSAMIAASVAGLAVVAVKRRKKK